MVSGKGILELGLSVFTHTEHHEMWKEALTSPTAASTRSQALTSDANFSVETWNILCLPDEAFEVVPDAMTFLMHHGMNLSDLFHYGVRYPRVVSGVVYSLALSLSFFPKRSIAIANSSRTHSL